ncbi:MAG: DUF411 domain-containing protein [Methylococcales bacterium]|nr:DUF411 domain-containing protein [Methylococcales bacterium]
MIKAVLIAGLWALSFGSYAETSTTISEPSMANPIEITVHRDPSCSCCGRWIKHLKKSNFQVSDVLSHDMQAVKDKYHVPKNMASCHTAIVNGYAIEGHVPAADIKALLNIKADIVGLSVPGMPVGTPGMEMGTKVDAYKVIGFDKNNESQVFNHYEAKE